MGLSDGTMAIGSATSNPYSSVGNAGFNTVAYTGKTNKKGTESGSSGFVAMNPPLPQGCRDIVRA